MKSALITVILSLAVIAGAGSSQRNPDERIVTGRSAPSGTQRQKPEAAPAQAAPAADQQDMEVLRSDLVRMRVLLNQMRTNLAFVQTSDTPLKHQFDLNNEMWQVVMDDMERRLRRMTPAPAHQR